MSFIYESGTQGRLVSDTANDKESCCFVAVLTEYNVTAQFIVRWICYGEIFQLEVNTNCHLVVGDALICSWHKKLVQGSRIGETASMRSPCVRNKPYTLNKHYTLTCVQVRGVWSTVYALISNFRIDSLFNKKRHSLLHLTIAVRFYSNQSKRVEMNISWIERV